MSDDHDFKPVEIERSVVNTEREEETGKVLDRRLDICQKRHSIKGIRVPERKMTHCNGSSSKDPDRIAEIHHVFPQPCGARKDLVEKRGNDGGKKEHGLPITQCGYATDGHDSFVFGMLAGHDENNYDCKRREQESNTLSTRIYCMQLFGQTGE